MLSQYKINIFIDFLPETGYIYIMKTFGNALKGIRKEKGLTQKELAAALNVTPQVVSRREKSELPPSYRTIKRLAKALNMTASAFYQIAFSIDPEEAARIVQNGEAPHMLEELLSSFYELNEKGQRRAVDFTADLAKIPEYRTK